MNSTDESLFSYKELTAALKQITDDINTEPPEDHPLKRHDDIIKSTIKGVVLAIGQNLGVENLNQYLLDCGITQAQIDNFLRKGGRL